MIDILERAKRQYKNRRRFVDEESFHAAVEALCIAAMKLKNHEGKYIPIDLYPEQAENIVLAILKAEHA